MNMLQKLVSDLDSISETEAILVTENQKDILSSLVLAYMSAASALEGKEQEAVLKDLDSKWEKFLQVEEK